MTPPLALFVMPVIVSGAAVFVNSMFPLVVFVALKLDTALFSVSVVPPTDDVLSEAAPIVAPEFCVSVPAEVSVQLSFVLLAVPTTMPPVVVLIEMFWLVPLSVISVPSTSDELLATKIPPRSPAPPVVVALSCPAVVVRIGVILTSPQLEQLALAVPNLTASWPVAPSELIFVPVSEMLPVVAVSDAPVRAKAVALPICTASAAPRVITPLAFSVMVPLVATMSPT